jgi:hypothetical protein
VAIYNELDVLRVVGGSLSIDRLLRALQFVLNKHAVLHTSLVFNNENGTLIQYITGNHHTFTLAVEQTFENENELQEIIHQTTIDPNLFNLSNSRVFFCQILRRPKMTNKINENNFITDSDVLLFGFHHAATDRSSEQIFYQDLCFAYNNNTTWSDDEQLLQYIDYSVYEHVMDMTLSREFWHLQLEGYNLEHPLSLPVDRHRLSTDQRSSLASVAQITFKDEISTAFLNYTSSHQVTPFQLGLATFYVFLFKLTHGETDLCITCINANRYRNELENMIGMFVSTLPYRIQLNSNWSIDEVVKHVREKCLSILEQSHYPLQHILADSHINQTNVPFLETIFDFITVTSNTNHIFFDDATLERILLEQSSQVAKFDLSVTFVYNPTSHDNKLSCCFAFSRDLFEETTVVQIARRFQYIVEQLFRTKSTDIRMDPIITSMNKLSLILPEEEQEIQIVKFCRLEGIFYEGM